MTTFKISNNKDNGQGSLRQAILAASINPGEDTIDLSNINGTIGLLTPLIVNLSGGNNLIIKSISNTTLDGGGKVEIMTINGGGVIQNGNRVGYGQVTIEGVNFAHGLAKGGDGIGNGGGGLGAGGAIYMTGFADVILQNSNLLYNQAQGGQGGSPLNPLDESAQGGWGGSVGANGQKGGMGGGLNGLGDQITAGGKAGTKQITGSAPQNATIGDVGQASKWLGVGGGGGGGGGGVASGQKNNPEPGCGNHGGIGGYGAGGGGAGSSGAYENETSQPQIKIGYGGAGGTFGGAGGHGASANIIDAGSPGSGGGGAGLGGAIFQESGMLKLNNVSFTNNVVVAGEAGAVSSGNTDNIGKSGKAYGSDLFMVGGALINVGPTDINLDWMFQDTPKPKIIYGTPTNPIQQVILPSKSSCIVVSNSNDSGEGSLRNAIKKAAESPGYDIIDLNQVGGSIKLDSPLIINAGNDLLIRDDGNSTLDGQNKSQIMIVKGADLTIQSLSFTNGLAKGGAGGTGGGGGGLGAGGALFVESGNINLYGDSFFNNKAEGGKGGAYVLKHGAGTGSGIGAVGGSGGGFNGNESSKGGKGGVQQNHNGYSGSAGDAGTFGQGGGGGGGGGGGTESYAGFGGPGGTGGFGGGGGGGGGAGAFENNKFKDNQGTGGAGGGAYILNGSQKTLGGLGSMGTSHNGDTAGNSGVGGGGAGLGGAIFLKTGSLNLFNTTFDGDSVLGGAAGDGGYFTAERGSALGRDIFNYQGVVNNIGSTTYDQKLGFADYLNGQSILDLVNGSSSSNFASLQESKQKLNSKISQINDLKTSYQVRDEGDKHYLYTLSHIGSWGQAETEARQLGGHLTTFNLSNSANYSQKINDLKKWYGSQESWIGLSDVSNEGDLKWDDGYKSSQLTNQSPAGTNNSGLFQELNSDFRDYGYLTKNGSLALDSSSSSNTPITKDTSAQIRNEITGNIENVITSSKLLTIPGNSTYLLTSASMTFQDAEKEAIAKGGHLVKIDSEYENMVVDAFVESSKNEKFVWIGLTDQENEGQWKWLMDGTNYSTQPSLWGTSYGNRGLSNNGAALQVVGGSNKWIDLPNTDKCFGVIEIPTTQTVLSSVSVNNPKPGIIEREYFEWNGSMYLLSGAAGWEEAQSQAKLLGGNLVSINSQEEQDWLVKTFKPETTKPFWIGATDKEKEGTFKWISDGSLLSPYSNWNSGEPNDDRKNEDYSMMLGDGRWNDISDSSSVLQKWLGVSKLPGIIEIPMQQRSSDVNNNSAVRTLAKPLIGDVSDHTANEQPDIFQLGSYLDNTPDKTMGGHSQKVWGGSGPDIFNVNFENVNSKIGLDFDSDKLKNLATSLVTPDWDVMTRRRAMEEASANSSKDWDLKSGLAQVAADTLIGLGKDVIDAGNAVPIFGSLSTRTAQIGLTIAQGAVDSGFVVANALNAYKSTMDQISASYNFDMQEYQDNLRGLDEFFEGEGKKSTGSWGDVDIDQKRSVVKIMDFEPGVDTVILPKPASELGMYSAKTYQADNTGTLVAISYTNQGSSQEAAKDFLFLQIANDSIPGLSGVALDKFIESLFMYGSDNVTISSQTYHSDSNGSKGLIGITDTEKSGTPADDFIYSLEENNNPVVTLRGEAGNDVLHGRSIDLNYEPQLSVLDGGEGNDVMYSFSINDTVKGGAGYDQVDFSNCDTVVDTSSSDFNRKNFTDLESFVGSDLNDTLSLTDTEISQQRAIEGLDYQMVSGTINFAPNERSKIISIPLKGQDKIKEAPEDFGLILEKPVNATLKNDGIENLSVINILDDDYTSELPTLSFNYPTAVEGDYMIFIPKINKKSAVPISFTPTIYTEVAVIGKDTKSANTMEMSIDGGKTWSNAEKVITIPSNTDVVDNLLQIRLKTIDDNESESNETFSFVAKNITGAQTGNDSNVVFTDGTIIDNDGSVNSFFINDATTNENNRTVEVTVIRGGKDVSASASISYRTLKNDESSDRLSSADIFHLDGKGGDDILIGTAYSDVIEGGAGDDKIQLVPDKMRDVITWTAPVLKNGKEDTVNHLVKFDTDYMVDTRDNSLHHKDGSSVPGLSSPQTMIKGKSIETDLNGNVTDYMFKYGSVPNDGSDVVKNFERNDLSKDLLKFEGVPEIDVVISNGDTLFKVQNSQFGTGNTLVTLVGVTGFNSNDVAAPDNQDLSKYSLVGANFHFA